MRACLPSITNKGAHKEKENLEATQLWGAWAKGIYSFTTTFVDKGIGLAKPKGTTIQKGA